MRDGDAVVDVRACGESADHAGMLADAVLPDTIAPLKGGVDLRSQMSGLADAGCVLLTGATGFLGRSLARELLHESTATLLCVIRAGQIAPRERLRSVLSAAGVDTPAFDARVRVVEGDLSKRWLGMGRATFVALADQVDAVCHAGALVNWVLPYRALRAANVSCTRDLLELACQRTLPFHFVSSLSVCYSTAVTDSRLPSPLVAPVAIDERYDALPDLPGLHLGYAQSKVVAEALVRAAGRRGLPVSIYRPSLIAGHSESGTFNPGDILARVVSGCVRMGVAPDVDWTLDCLPVDTAARLIIDLSTRRGVTHLRHARPRHWRECVLWMRLYGYDVRLVPYDSWLRQLASDTEGAGRSHPLRPLRSFFVHRPAGARGLTQPELLMGSDRVFRSDAPGVDAAPALDAALLERYFAAFVAAGVLPAPTREAATSAARPHGAQASTPTPRLRWGTREDVSHSLAASSFSSESPESLDAAIFSNAMDAAISAADPLGRLSHHSIVSELTAWHTGSATGLFRYRLRGEQIDCEVVAKIKAPDHDVIAVGEALAQLCDDRIGDAYARWAHRLGLVASDVRELAIYAQRDPRFTRHAPAALGSARDAATGVCALVLESLEDVHLKDSVDRPELWTSAHLERAIHGLACLQAIWYGCERTLVEQPWIGHVATATTTSEMSDLWQAIATHATPRFSAWTDRAIGSIQQRLIASIDQWWPAQEALPRTLTHNDFNPRNICFRNTVEGPRLVAYDWELAAVGAAQHDLAELLCFVLPSTATDTDIDFWLERHRRYLQDETGSRLDTLDWQQGFRAALYDLMLNRLPMYALVHRVRPQPFLPRVVRTWRRLYERFPLQLSR